MRAELSENPPQTIFEIPTNKFKKSNRFTEISGARIRREVLRLAKPNFPNKQSKDRPSSDNASDFTIDTMLSISKLAPLAERWDLLDRQPDPQVPT